MPYKVRAVPNSLAASNATSGGGGAIALTLDRIPGSCTEMWLRVGANLTISGAASILDDWMDRFILNLALTYSTTNYFNFNDMTLAHHLMRFQGMAPPRMTIPSSATNVTFYSWYRLHFGTVPYVQDKVTGRWKENPFDLSAAIPQLPANSLSLQGTWGSSTSLAASGITVNSLSLQPYFTYITNKENESAADFQPQAFPSWTTEADASLVTAGYSAFGQTIALPIGDYIQGALFMARTGSVSLRSDAVLSSLKFRDTSGNRDIFSFSSWDDATAITQQSRTGADDGQVPPTDGLNSSLAYTAGPVANPGSTYGSTFVQPSNQGLAYFDMRDWISEPDPFLGLNMDPQVNPYSQLVWQMGTNAAATNVLNILYKKYKKNFNAVPQTSGVHPMVAAAMASAGR